jgi:hypothetical protein
VIVGVGFLGNLGSHLFLVLAKGVVPLVLGLVHRCFILLVALLVGVLMVFRFEEQVFLLQP